MRSNNYSIVHAALHTTSLAMNNSVLATRTRQPPAKKPTGPEKSSQGPPGSRVRNLLRIWFKQGAVGVWGRTGGHGTIVSLFVLRLAPGDRDVSGTVVPF